MLYYAGTVQWLIRCLLETDFDDNFAITVVDEKPTFFVFGSGYAALGLVAKRVGNLTARQDDGDQGECLAFPRRPHVIQVDAPRLVRIDF